MTAKTEAGMQTESTSNEAPTDVFPDFAISLEEANRRVRMLQQYVREHMHEGEDYGVIPGSTKPTLFKPGAEKLNAIFGLAPTMEVTNRLEDWDHGFVSYEVKVTLINKRTGNVEAEGVGACNSAEKRYRTQDAANIANTILKISKKRALIDATLSATRASGLFTQDLEDLDLEQMNRDQRPANDNSGTRSGSNEHRFVPAGEVASHNTHTLTDAQHRAILAIASRVFGHSATPEDFASILDTPIELLSKGDASVLIDRLRVMLAERQSAGSRDNNRAHRSTNNSQREAIAA